MDSRFLDSLWQQEEGHTRHSWQVYGTGSRDNKNGLKSPLKQSRYLSKDMVSVRLGARRSASHTLHGFFVVRIAIQKKRKSQQHKLAYSWFSDFLTDEQNEDGWSDWAKSQPYQSQLWSSWQRCCNPLKGLSKVFERPFKGLLKDFQRPLKCLLKAF